MRKGSVSFPKPVPWIHLSPSLQVNCLPPALQPGGGGGLIAPQPHTSTNALLTLTGLPMLSNEMLPSICPLGMGDKSATKKSLNSLHTQSGHSYVKKLKLNENPCALVGATMVSSSATASCGSPVMMPGHAGDSLGKPGGLLAVYPLSNPPTSM